LNLTKIAFSKIIPQNVTTAKNEAKIVECKKSAELSEVSEYLVRESQYQV